MFDASQDRFDWEHRSTIPVIGAHGRTIKRTRTPAHVRFKEDIGALEDPAVTSYSHSKDTRVEFTREEGLIFPLAKALREWR